MRIHIRRPLFVAFGMLIVGSAGVARADEIDSRFFGHWKGPASIIDYRDDQPQQMDRLGEVDIVKVGSSGFEIRNSLMATTSDKEMRLTAEPTGITAIHQVFQPVSADRWAAQKACTDLTKQKGCGWAHLVGSTLVIDVILIDKTGTEELLSTRRQLTNDGSMKVVFHRISDGRVTRVIEGSLKNESASQ